MSNTRRVTPVKPKAPVLGKWAQLQAEAQKRAAGRGERPKIEPYVISDVEPPIVITAPDDKRLLIIMECMGPNGEFNMALVMPLLRAMCGDQFGRIWTLIPNDDPAASDMLVLLAQELSDHFRDALSSAREAAELPGGTEGSSN